MKRILQIMWISLAINLAQAGVDVEPFEKLIQQGKPEEAMSLLNKELEKDPNNPRLLYDYGVAAYAAKRYDEALLSFDRVETSRDRSLVEKARKQKGNAEFQLGLSARTSNLDETIDRWKNSLGNYRAALKSSPEDALAKNNHDLVQKLLMDLLLKAAQQHMKEAHQPWARSDFKIDELRQAMEKFDEAKRVDEKNTEAQQGEKQAREELAQELAKQGEEQAKRKPNQRLEQQIPEMQKGVNKLEDANRLLPENKPIEQKLDQARQNLADALTELAKQQIQESKRSQWDREKFEKMEKAMDNAQKALDQKPDHQEAAKTLEEAKAELSKMHEERGDKENREADHSSMEQAVNKLNAAMEDYKEASDLKKDQDPQLNAKAEKTKEKLENALQKLADKNMQAQQNEGLDEKAHRLETAQTALQELEQIKPSQKTEQQLADVTKQLADTRQQLAERNRNQPQQPQEVAQMEKKPAKQDSIPDLEKMPHLKQQPMGGEFKSDKLNKTTKDY